MQLISRINIRVNRCSSVVSTRHKTGFTLLEIMLVVLVIGIAASAIMPAALDSVEGIRLRSATREVIGLNKYARARAILDRKPVGVLYDQERGVVQLVQLPAPQMALGPFLDTPAARLQDPGQPFTDNGGPVTSLRRKKLADYVVVDKVEDAAEVDDTYYAVYYPSGMCDAHTVVLRDNRGDTARIKVWGMTGDIELEPSR